MFIDVLFGTLKKENKDRTVKAKGKKKKYVKAKEKPKEGEENKEKEYIEEEVTKSVLFLCHLQTSIVPKIVTPKNDFILKMAVRKDFGVLAS
jgi:hypothetical protein